MAEKKGAGGEPQEYNESNGRYGSGGDNKEGSELLNAVKNYKPNDLKSEVYRATSKPLAVTDKQEPSLTVKGEAAEKLYTQIKAGNYLSAEELRNHPVLRELDRVSEEYKTKYGYTSEINTPERQQLRKDIENGFLQTNPATKREHKAVIAIGLPAAGKSTVVAEPLAKEMGAFIFDSDEIKKGIPEFRESNGGAASSVHRESKDIQESAFAHFLSGGDRNGDNLIIPVIGDDLQSLQKKYISKLEEAGYDVEVVYKDANPTESLNRVIARAIKTGRIIPSNIVLGYGDKPRGVFEELRKIKGKNSKPYVRREAY